MPYSWIASSDICFDRGCVTVKVLANILEAISEDGEPDFDMLDGFEELSTENQAKVKKAVLKGELDEADKTDVSGFACRK